MKNYHKEIGLPDTIIIPEALYHLHYTDHAIERKNDYSLLVLPTVVRTNKNNVFEIYTQDDIVCIKILVRVAYDRNRDISLVLEILPDKKTRVVTFWLNNKKDKHRHFNKERYVHPNNKTPN